MKKRKKRSIKELIECGYIEIIGVDEQGKEIFRLTDQFFDENPEIVDEMKIYDSDILASLWFKGFIDLRIDESSEFFINLTDKSKKWKISKELTEREKVMMYNIILNIIQP